MAMRFFGSFLELVLIERNGELQAVKKIGWLGLSPEFLEVEFETPGQNVVGPLNAPVCNPLT